MWVRSLLGRNILSLILLSVFSNQAWAGLNAETNSCISLHVDVCQHWISQAPPDGPREMYDNGVQTTAFPDKLIMTYVVRCGPAGLNAPFIQGFCPIAVVPKGSFGPEIPVLDGPYLQCGSVISQETRTLSETIAIPGAPFYLSYSTDRVEGRKADYGYWIPWISDLATEARLTIHVAGRQIEGSQSPNMDFLIKWDGKDSAGKLTLSAALAKVHIQPFNGTSQVGSGLTLDLPVGHLKAKQLGLGGWMPSIYHFYDPILEVLFRGDGTTRSVRAKKNPDGTFFLAEVDGSVAYTFNAQGFHLKTQAGRTGKTLYSFARDSKKYLTQITDGFGLISSFQRNSLGVLTGIKAPNGKVSTVALDAGGFLSKVTLPGGAVYTITSTSDGLLTKFQQPAGQISTFTYDGRGLLTRDEHSGGYFQTLSGKSDFSSHQTRMGKTTTSDFSTTRTAGDYTAYQKIVHPDSSVEDLLSRRDENSRKTPNSSVSLTYQNDLRFGAMAPFVNGIFSNSSVTRRTQALALSDVANPFSIVTEQIEEFRDGATAFSMRSVYNGSTKKYSMTSGVGRMQSLTIDQFERPLSVQVGSFNPINFTYTSNRLTKITHGTRISTFTYDLTTKLLSQAKDPLSRITSYMYDQRERLTQITLPDLRVIKSAIM